MSITAWAIVIILAVILFGGGFYLRHERARGAR